MESLISARVSSEHASRTAPLKLPSSSLADILAANVRGGSAVAPASSDSYW